MITFEEFEKQINDIKRITAFNDNINCLTVKYNKECKDQAELMFPSLESNVIWLLRKIMNDKGDWISYWIYELDFGTKYHEGCVTDENGKNINLETVKDLWSFLLVNWWQS